MLSGTVLGSRCAGLFEDEQARSGLVARHCVPQLPDRDAKHDTGTGSRRNAADRPIADLFLRRRALFHGWTLLRNSVFQSCRVPASWASAPRAAKGKHHEM